MILVMCVKESEFKPELFQVREKDREKVDTLTKLKAKDSFGKEFKLTKRSDTFDVDERTANMFLIHYGVKEYLQITGWWKSEEGDF